MIARTPVVLEQNHFIAQVNTLYTNTIVKYSQSALDSWLCECQFMVAVFQDLLQLGV